MSERLRRLLLVVPAARARPGIRLAELAESLACSPDELRKDIDLLACVGAPPFLPDDLIDIELRDDRVYVSLPQSFDRPTRLSATEAAALATAVRALAPTDPLLAGAVEKLSKAVLPGQKQLYEGLLSRFNARIDDEGSDGIRQVLERGIRERRVVDIVYFARTELAARPRRVRPRAFAAVDGVAYLSAQNEDGAERTYRLDRVARATLSNDTFAPLPEIDVEEKLSRVARLDESTELPRARLRFTPQVADAAKSRHPGATVNADGSLEAALPYSSVPWLVSYALSWGGAAEILHPPEARQALRETVQRALAAHADA